MDPQFSGVAFQDSARAAANLERVARAIPSALHAPLASLLSQSPDPDGALNLLERYASQAPADVLASLAQHPTGLTYLVAIFGYSAFLADTFLAEPGLPAQFARDRNFTKLKSKEDLMQDYARFSTTAPDPWLASQLARFKRRTYLRIALKDVLGVSTLAETTLELSELADVIIHNALVYCAQQLRTRYGEPQYRDAEGRIGRSEMAVISLGKLGGNELNYSSDIDLLFLYSRDGETSGGSEPDSVISNKEYFVRLANAVTRTITQSTPYGQTFRVDLRLRPEGEQGDLAISLASAREYYERRARDWELQMLIKARHSAGDERLTRDFLRHTEPYVYGAPADFAAIETVLLTRERISKKMSASHSEGTDIKQHRGGIRDIEFLTQCLQRLHGGRDHWVRSGGTLLALRKLNDKRCLSDRDYAGLNGAYELLRKIEHRIQLDSGRQTHRLPLEPEPLDRLARRVRAERGGTRAIVGPHGVAPALGPGAALVARVDEVFRTVDAIYQHVIHPRTAAAEPADYALSAPSFTPSDQAGTSYEAALDFVSRRAPELAQKLERIAPPARARKNIARFLASVFSTPEGFSLARERPEQVARGAQIVSASDFLADLLIHRPGEVVNLEFPEGATDDADQLEIRFDTSANAVPPGHAANAEPFRWMLDSGWGMREQMALLRKHFQTQKLALGGRDVIAFDSVLASLARWSLLACRSITTAACAAMQSANGAEFALPAQRPFAILGLGRLGLQEFDLASDADLVFIVPSGTPEQEMEWWTALAGRIIEALSSYTSDGTLFPVDTRLRPRGQEGELVITEEALLAYLQSAAQVWEGVTYLKASAVAGDAKFGASAVARIQAKVLERFSRHEALAAEMRQMRARLEREMAGSPGDPKNAAGGYYDIDYILAFLRLRYQVSLPSGANTVAQIRALASQDFLNAQDAETLERGATILRGIDHAVRLVTGKAAQGLRNHVGHAAQTEDLARQWRIAPEGRTIAEEAAAVQGAVRAVYDRIVG